MKKLLVIGGPIGAGKMTAAHRMLPEALNIREFLHADAIARGLWPLNPEGKAVAAGREIIRRIRGLALSGANFAFEATCAGRSRLRSATDLGRSGWGVQWDSFTMKGVPSLHLSKRTQRPRSARG